jgi:hypothetical protein
LDCQKVDWKHGGHREACQSINIQLVSSPQPLPFYSTLGLLAENTHLDAQNLSFMRALLYQNITEHKFLENASLVEARRLPHLRRIAQNNSSKPFVTVMNYTDMYPMKSFRYKPEENEGRAHSLWKMECAKFNLRLREIHISL